VTIWHPDDARLPPTLWLITTSGAHPLGLFSTREQAEGYGRAWLASKPGRPEARWRLFELPLDSDQVTERAHD